MTWRVFAPRFLRFRTLLPLIRRACSLAMRRACHCRCLTLRR
jgi:hypothetical protein